jgi:hypothetical protein
MFDVNLRKQKMKSIISISFGFGLLISHTFGSTVNLMEGAIGEAEATVSFFEGEVNKTVTKVEQAIVALKSTLQDSKPSTVVLLYQQDAALANLKANLEALGKLLPLLTSSQFNAEKMRLMLGAMPQDSDEESVAE